MLRIGQGYDVHRLVRDRKLIIGGVEIPYEYGLLGHSDADVLIHAIIDALFGAAALFDIGHNFPDNDDMYLGADSLKLLETAADMVLEKGYRVVNIDSTVIAQEPKLSKYIYKMRENISKACKIDPDFINIKATTEENLGFTGKKEGIAAQAVCLIESK